MEKVSNSTVTYSKQFKVFAVGEDYVVGGKAFDFNIYDKMEGGKLLMPDDWASQASNMIKARYENEKLINESTFEQYCKEFKQNPKDIIKRLKNKGFNLTDEHLLITDDAKAQMQKDIEYNIVPWINEFVEYRPSVVRV